MVEVMRFRGGPWDGESKASYEGFPAPDIVQYEIDGQRHEYTRTGRCHGPVGSVHFYTYTGDRDGETSSAPAA